MKKWIIGIIVIIILLVAGKQGFSYIYNEKLISEYESGDYSMDTEPLFFMNELESYIAHYNNGNICYKQEDYSGAIDEYNTALGLNPPEEEECSIRINLALAMIYNMGEDYAAPENIQASIDTLKEAREVLLAEGCASDEGEGHSATAQKLKEEIDELIKQLEEQQSSSSSSQEEEQEEQSQEDSYEEDIKEQLQQNQADAHEEREENLEMYEDYNFNSDYEGIW